MGSERSRDRLSHSLPAMQVPADRVSAADPKVHHSGNREHSFRDENFPEGILLSGLPLHLGEGRRSTPAAGGLGNILLEAALVGRDSVEPPGWLLDTRGSTESRPTKQARAHDSFLNHLPPPHEMAFPFIAC